MSILRRSRMPITRAKASRLLNQKEMALYDDSRINGLRALDAKALASRITRARTARDRARDLVQKHKLASRERTGSKRGTSGQANQRSKDKAEVMTDILKRFEGRLKEVERAGGGTTAKAKTAPAKTSKAAKKTAAKTATGTAAKKTVKKTAKKAATPATPAKRPAAGKKAAAAKKSSSTAARKRATGKATRKRGISPERALEQTRALLEAKQAHDAEPRPWQDLAAGVAPGEGEPGYQSNAARRRALRLHAAEARIPAIQGSSSTRDRINQGKRDHRGDTDD